jgi:two-component system chemotaxis sensor kinase CheA
MKTRMQPIDNVWNKLPRVVRDLAVSCGKQVRVEMEGKDTELDKSLIEAIKDPLTHVIRNSVDHGIEPPEKRVSAGKPAEGRLLLRAYHEGGSVNIEVSDDGGGVDLDRVKRKAIERGLIGRDQANQLSERQAVELLFTPGFSTAQKVTNVSGRGVGLDVVKTNIEKIGGTVDIVTLPKQGTTIKIKIPLTLAIIPALRITSAGDHYAIPQVNLLELVRLEGDQARKGVETIHGAPVYRLRGNLLPLVYLNRELRIAEESEALRNGQSANGAGEGEALDDFAVNIVVLQADDRQFGLVVDNINDTEEIVVKPLGKLLKGLTTFAGATIMGDGRVALILDVMGLAQRASVITAVREHSMADTTVRSHTVTQERRNLLLFRSPDNGRMAVPLTLVTRLEEFPAEAVERAGNQEMVQYRDDILPLIPLGSLLPERRRQVRHASGKDAARKGTIEVIVYSGANRRSVGLVVDQILDIVEDDQEIQQTGTREGLLGSVVIQGKVTEVVDLEGLLRSHDKLSSGKRGKGKVPQNHG